MKFENDIFKIKHNDVKPEKGSILIAEPFMRGAYFQRSVVLLTEHDGNETMGFVLNKQTQLVMNDYFSDLVNIPSIPIYLGGPVASNRIFFLHTLGGLIPESQKINEGLYFDGDFKVLVNYLMFDRDIACKVKFFIGYSGWEKEQLAGEISENSWIVSNSSNANIINACDEVFWRSSLSVLGKKYTAWSKYPKDPLMN